MNEKRTKPSMYRVVREGRWWLVLTVDGWLSTTCRTKKDAELWISTRGKVGR